MDFYIIPPVSNLELMNQGDRFFCLSQLYLKHQKYREFFKQKVRDGAWVTLDNGAGDHDTVEIEDLLNIARDLRPSELIPLDILFDGVETLKNLHKTIELMKVDPILRDIEIFACPQGDSEEQWIATYVEMLYNIHVKTIGMSKLAIPHVVSRSSNDQNIARDRNYMYNLLKGFGLIRKPLHFLGAGEIWEFELYKQDPLCRSTDSCFSVWGGMNNQRFDKDNYKRIPTPKDYFDRVISPDSVADIQSNIDYIKNILK